MDSMHLATVLGTTGNFASDMHVIIRQDAARIVSPPRPLHHAQQSLLCNQSINVHLSLYLSKYVPTFSFIVHGLSGVVEHHGSCPYVMRNTSVEQIQKDTMLT
jgi:hypothetical protein